MGKKVFLRPTELLLVWLRISKNRNDGRRLPRLGCQQSISAQGCSGKTTKISSRNRSVWLAHGDCRGTRECSDLSFGVFPSAYQCMLPGLGLQRDHAIPLLV